MINYVVNEKDVRNTISDFEIFCNYLLEKKPKLTKNRQELGKKDCFIINGLLSNPRDLDGPKYLQPTYPTINLFFHIILEVGLFKIDYAKGKNLYLIPTPKFKEYEALSPYNKYILLFKTYWTRLDFSELYFDTMTVFNHFLYTKLAFEKLAIAKPGERIFANVEDFNNGYDRSNPIHKFFIGAGLVVHHLSVFGFWEYEEAHIPDFHTSKKDIDVKAIIPTGLGIAMINACRKRPYELYNEYRDEDFIERSWDDEYLWPLIEELGLKRPVVPRKKLEEFALAFIEYFPKGAIDIKAINNILENKVELPSGNTYIFKVSLNKITWRKIRIAANKTLQHLHNAIQEAFDFDNDHLFAFFMDGKLWSKKAYWDKREGSKPTADQAVLSEIGLSVGKRFLYLFDFGNEWRFDVQLEETLALDKPPQKAEIIAQKGDAPEQYPDWEDIEGYDSDYDDEFDAGDEYQEVDLEDAMLKALALAKEYGAKAAAKREAELWAEISSPFSLQKFLAKLTKDELTEIRKNLEIKGISNLKKGQLAKTLAKEIPGLIKKILYRLDYRQYKILKKIVNQKGIAEITLSMEQVEFFRRHGIVFSGTVNGKRVLIMPDEIIPVFRLLDDDVNYQSIIKRNTEWIRITQGLLYYYGTLKTNKLVEMVGTYTKKIENTESMDFLEVLGNAEDYYEEIRSRLDSFSHYRVFDPDKVLEEHAKRADLDFYPFSYDQIYKAGVEEFVDKNLAFNRFVKFLMENYDIALSEAEDIVEECVYAIRLEEPLYQIIDYLQHFFEIDNLELMEEFSDQLMFLNNNTRQWVLKGYMPAELREINSKNLHPLANWKPRLVVDNTNKPKVGRNDPCPCGSGKKYKKCCGKNR